MLLCRRPLLAIERFHRRGRPWEAGYLPGSAQHIGAHAARQHQHPRDCLQHIGGQNASDSWWRRIQFHSCRHRTRRRNQPEPAGWPKDKSSVIGGWLRWLTCALGKGMKLQRGILLLLALLGFATFI